MRKTNAKKDQKEGQSVSQNFRLDYFIIRQSKCQTGTEKKFQTQFQTS